MRCASRMYWSTACLAWVSVLSAASRTLCDRSDCARLPGDPDASVGCLAIIALLGCLLRWTQVQGTGRSRGLSLFAAERFAVDRVGVPVGDLARVVHQKPGLLHGVLGQARQVGLAHPHLR